MCNSRCFRTFAIRFGASGMAVTLRMEHELLFISVLVRGAGAPAVKSCNQSYLQTSYSAKHNSKFGFFGDGVPKCMDVGGLRGHMHIVDPYARCT